MRDRGAAPSRFVVIPDERYLDAKECAERAHTTRSRWFKEASESEILQAGRRVRGRRTFWLLSSVVEYLHSARVGAA